ncbi:hypothetical protein ACS8E9_03590, partial [Pseudomonas neustonica]|uniref:hypothetical protein n=1 Tax=Pseudomonas neustonica TaxID=2487346 RepID=UPI003F44C0B9
VQRWYIAGSSRRKTYNTVRDQLTTTAWGFLFIKADGSYRSVSGSRSDGFEFDPDMVCVEPKDAKFQFAPDRKRWSLDKVQSS